MPPRSQMGSAGPLRRETRATYARIGVGRGGQPVAGIGLMPRLPVGQLESAATGPWRWQWRAGSSAASRVRERARSAVAAAGGHERRLRALAGHHRAAPCRRGASAGAIKACGLWLLTATTDFGVHFDPKEVLLLSPMTHIPIDAELNLLFVGTLYFWVKVNFDEVI